jgi:hypothetical protein
MTEAETDFYKDLGVPRDADAKLIRTRYRQLAKIHHPDKDGGDRDKFNVISRAYRTLGNADARAEYDKRGAERKSDQDDPMFRAAVSTISTILNGLYRHPKLASLNVVNEITGNLKAMRDDHVKNRSEADLTITQLKKVLKKLKFKGKGQDVLIPMIQSQVDNIELAKLRDIEQQAVVDKALTLIDGGYDYYPDAPGGPYQFTNYMSIKSPFINDTTT